MTRTVGIAPHRHRSPSSEGSIKGIPSTEDIHYQTFYNLQYVLLRLASLMIFIFFLLPEPIRPLTVSSHCRFTYSSGHKQGIWFFLSLAVSAFG
ncbi:Transcriptional activator protein acu-15 [Fusarium oxysporum f. sp. albedinis]|nr:Transcriptional activator protein acu-15 [Fusarium oxysporum f. sp. albedinis]